MPRIPPHTPPRSPFADFSLAWDMEGYAAKRRPKWTLLLVCVDAAPGCSSCSQPISIVHRAPLAMSAPCGRFRAAVRWLQVGTQLGMGM